MKLRELFENIEIIEIDDIDRDELDALFSEELKVSGETIDAWSEQGKEVIHLDDQMGNDTIFDVDGKFVLYDRHSGIAYAAPSGTNLNTIRNLKRE